MNISMDMAVEKLLDYDIDQRTINNLKKANLNTVENTILYLSKINGIQSHILGRNGCPKFLKIIEGLGFSELVDGKYVFVNPYIKLIEKYKSKYKVKSLETLDKKLFASNSFDFELINDAVRIYLEKKCKALYKHRSRITLKLDDELYRLYKFREKSMQLFNEIVQQKRIELNDDLDVKGDLW